MTLEQAKQLHKGDMVWWNDPDNSTCSRMYTILEIEIIGETVRIVDMTGDVLECFSCELS